MESGWQGLHLRILGLWSFRVVPCSHPTRTFIIVKKPSCLSSPISHGMDFATYISMVSFDMFLCPLFFS